MSGCCALARDRRNGGTSADDLSARLHGTNVNPQTFLATDYLNHFNEIVMVLEILGDCPDCFEDAHGWRPKSYRQHFIDSALSDRMLAVEAYDHAPRRYRQPFDRIVEHMDHLVMFALRRLETPVACQDEAATRRIAGAVARRLQDLVAMASAIIHGTIETADQRHVDALFSDARSQP